MGSNTHHDIRRRSHRFVACAAIAATALTACGGDDDEAAGPATAEETAAASASADAGLITTANSVPGDAGDVADVDLGAPGRDIIIEMHVTMGSDDIQRTVGAIRDDAARLGGNVTQADVNFGSGVDGGHATLVIKLPPAQVEALIGGLDQAGVVRSISQSAQDVTEQLVDLDVRLSNARKSVENVREFMDRATDLKDLVTLEGELTRRQTELEQLEAQQRNLADRVALSTVTIEILPIEDLPAVEADPGIADAFSDGWSAFASFVFGIGYVLAVLLPFLVLAALLGLAIWYVRRRMVANANQSPLGTRAGDSSLPAPPHSEPPHSEPGDRSSTPPGGE
jgi:hypothetical protein